MVRPILVLACFAACGCRPDPDGELTMGLWERRVDLVSDSATSVQASPGARAAPLVPGTPRPYPHSFCISSADQYVGIRAFDRLLLDGDCSAKQIEFRHGAMRGSATCFLDPAQRLAGKLSFTGTYSRNDRIEALADLEWPAGRADLPPRRLRMKVTLRRIGECTAQLPVGQEPAA